MGNTIAVVSLDMVEVAGSSPVARTILPYDNNNLHHVTSSCRDALIGIYNDCQWLLVGVECAVYVQCRSNVFLSRLSARSFKSLTCKSIKRGRDNGKAEYRR